MNRPASVFISRRLGRLWFGLGILAASISASISAHAQWISSHRVADTAYFLFSFPSRVERYDLAARSWLPAVPLPSTYGMPTCGWVDPDGIYVTYGGRSVYRHDLLGGNTTHVMNSAVNVSGLLTDGNWLFINQSDQSYGRFVSIDKTTGSIIGNFENYIDSVHGASIVPAVKKIFGRSTGVSPSDITFVSYDNTGHLLSGGDSPHHGDYPNASKTWGFPSGTRVIDSSGTLYSTATLEYAGSLGTAVDDIQFPADSGPIIVRGNAMTAYTSNLLPAGSATLPFAPRSFFLNAADAVIFSSDNTKPNGINVQAIPLSSLGTPPIPNGVDPSNLAYVPDQTFLANDGTLLLVSKKNKSIFRWSPETRQYLPTIPLVKAPVYSAYSTAGNSIYLADKLGVVRSIDLSATSPVEVPFAILPTAPLGLTVAGAFVFTADSSGAWGTHRTFNAAGVQISAKDWNYYSEEYIWSEAAQKIYHFRDDTSPNDLLWEEVNANGTAYPELAPGAIGGDLDTPLHGSDYFQHPIRVSPDGSVVVLGSGAIFDATTLALLPLALPTSVDDIVWQGGKINTIRTVSGSAKLERWAGPTLGLNGSLQLSGKALRLFVLDEARILAVCLSPKGQPDFHVLTGNFEIVPPTSLATPAGLSITNPSPGKLLLEWSDVAGELGYIVQRKPSGSSDNWNEIGQTGASEAALEFGVIPSNDTFDYRVIATHGELLSDPSLALENVLSGPPLPPESFTLDAVSASSATLSWQDGALADGYRLESRRPGKAWKAVLFPAEDSVSATVTGLESNTPYDFRIAARNPLGLSKWATVAGITRHGQGEISVILSPDDRELTDHVSGLDFGSVQVGGKSQGAARLTIRNVGKNELRNVSFKLAGPNPDDFSVIGRGQAGIGSGGSMEIEVKFSATRMGRRGAVLRIFSTDANESPFDILLGGDGLKKGSRDKDPEPRLESAQHFNGLRQFTTGTTGVEAGEAAAFE
ncbi:MAG: choice-of-anchor D domain-containing protein [Verrucomicrobiota bacterium]